MKWNAQEKGADPSIHLSALLKKLPLLSQTILGPSTSVLATLAFTSHSTSEVRTTELVVESGVFCLPSMHRSP